MLLTRYLYLLIYTHNGDGTFQNYVHFVAKDLPTFMCKEIYVILLEQYGGHGNVGNGKYHT